MIRVRYLFLWFLGVPGILVLLLWFTRAIG